MIPDTRPDTAFIDGICSACIAYAERKSIDWQARRAAFDELLVRIKRTRVALGNGYDCIVPSSGGKDSHYQVLTLIEQGLRPLVVTASTCHLTPIGRENIDNLARHATTIEITPNRDVRADLNRLGLEMVGDISWPEHAAIFTLPFRAAAQMRIPFLFYGENPQNQYGSPSPEASSALQMTRRWRSEFGGFLGLRPEDLAPLTSDVAMRDYMLPPEERMVGIEAHFIGQYIPWDSHRNAEVAKAAGMRQQLPCVANWWDHENLDNAQTGLHDHLMFRKYGYGRGAAQISVDVRAERISRAEALAWVERYDGTFPTMYAGVFFADVLKRIGISQGELFSVLNSFTNWPLFEDEAAPLRPAMAI